MPVLTVSENTWPQVGFSRKRSIQPSSSMMTMPNSSGSGTRVRPIVTSAPLSLVELDQVGEVDVGERVAGDDEEGLVAQRVLGVLDAAGGAERRLLGGVVQRHAELLAVAEVVADQAGEELHGDDDLVEAVPLEQPQDVLHHRPVDHGQQRLGHVRGQRPQPGALAAGHDDGLHAGHPLVRALSRSGAHAACAHLDQRTGPLPTSTAPYPRSRTPSRTRGPPSPTSRRRRSPSSSSGKRVQQVEGGGLAEEVHRQRAVAVPRAARAACSASRTSRPTSSDASATAGRRRGRRAR